MLKRFNVYLLLLTIFIVSCDDSIAYKTDKFVGLAMVSGMQIKATNKNGTVIIEYLSPSKRRYIWEGYEEVRVLIPRKRKWLGMLGGYNPATRYFWEFWKPMPRIVANDSEIHFDNMDELVKFLYQGSEYYDWTYTDDGLIVGFGHDDTREQVNIDVFQAFVDGKKPDVIDGSRSDNIHVIYKN
jgi:hypothetical protein